MGCHRCTTEMFHWFSYLPAAILMYFWTFWPRIFSRICLRIYCLYGLNSCWNHCNTLLLLQTGTLGVSQTCNNFSGTLSIQVDILKFNIIYILCILIKSITVLVVWYFWRRGEFVLFLSFNFIYSFQFNASSYWNRMTDVNHQNNLQIERVSVFLLCYYLCCSWYVLFCSTTNRNVDI